MRKQRKQKPETKQEINLVNLIERLWKFMKGKVLYKKYYEKFDEFKEATLGFFENIEQYKDELDSLLTNNFQLLDANAS